MKPTFIELTYNDHRVLINLDNVIKFEQRKDDTLITFNCKSREIPYAIGVKEQYDTIKTMIDKQK
jgi:hypothetical protein